MATDSTLQKIADNLLAQFDKTLLDNSTDFSSCDQILNAAPSEHKGGLESLYCDLLLDALISGYYRYSEMDTKQLVDDPLAPAFVKIILLSTTSKSSSSPSLRSNAFRTHFAIWICPSLNIVDSIILFFPCDEQFRANLISECRHHPAWAAC